MVALHVDAYAVPGLIAAGLELLAEVEASDTSLVTDSVRAEAERFRALVDEHVEIVGAGA